MAVRPGAGCARCDAGRGCGQGLLFRWFTADRTLHFRLRLDARHAVGQQVAVAIDPSDLARLALVAYGAPLVLLLAGIAAGTGLAGEVGALLGALLGLAAGVAVLRVASRASDRLLRVSAPAAAPIHD